MIAYCIGIGWDQSYHRLRDRFSGLYMLTIPITSWSSGFCPPHCYQASLAGTSSLLRAHLPPCMSLAVCLSLLLQDRPQRSSPSDDTGLPQLGQAPCERSHPQSRNRSDRVLDIALFCRLATPVAPNLVRLRYVPLTSYGFLQTPPLPVTPLPFGLSSPRSGRRLHLAGGRVCPLRWANKKGRPGPPNTGESISVPLFTFAPALPPALAALFLQFIHLLTLFRGKKLVNLSLLTGHEVGHA